MKKIINLICIFSMFFCFNTYASPSANKAASTSNTAAKVLTQKLKQIRTLQADYTQVTSNSRGKALKNLQGNLILKRPNQIRWSTVAPSDQLLVADGRTLWIYDKDLSQVTIRQQRGVVAAGTPAALLSGDIDRAIGRYTVTQQEGNAFLLVSKHASSQYKQIQLVFNGDNLSSMRMWNEIGQVVQISLNNVRINETVPDTAFQFKVPAGVDIIQPGQTQKDRRVS